MLNVGGLLAGFVDLIFPPECIICADKKEFPICEKCLKRLPVINGNICLRCGKPTEYEVERCRECRGRRLYFDKAVSFAKYEKGMREIIHSLKYRNCLRTATMMAKKITEGDISVFYEVEIITYIPMDRKRKLERGFNQAELLSKKVSKEFNVHCIGLLETAKEFKEQNTLDLKERRENIKGAFKLNPINRKEIKGRNILIVDDVYTTGHTVNEAAKVLKKERPAFIGVFTLARTIKR